jgi:hypothetical protein
VRIVPRPVSAFLYRYELRRGDEIVATGHLSAEEPFSVGDPIMIGERQGIVRSVEPVLGERELRLLVQLRRQATDPES